MGEHDASYRRLFEHSHLLRDLLACVLDAAWLARLDWSGLQPVNIHYVGDRLQERAGDGAWRIPYRAREGDLYVLLMLENQGRPERIMALRTASYAGLLYQSLLRQKLIRLPLPPILPIVLYSGRRPWRAPLDLASLIETGVPGLSEYQLQMRYLLIDEGALLRAGGLPDRNLAALLFRLEHSGSIEELQEMLHTLEQALRGPGFEELNRSFAAYVRHIVLSRARPLEAMPTATNLQELAMLISEKPGMWARQWEKEGIQKGLRQGRQEGRQEGALIGQAILLERLLTRKFGALPDAVAARIRQGTSAQLEAWSLNILDAATLDEVFGD